MKSFFNARTKYENAVIDNKNVTLVGERKADCLPIPQIKKIQQAYDQ